MNAVKRIVALHGNLGLPEDWNELEECVGLPFEKRNLWRPGTLEFCDGDFLLGYSMGGRLALQAAAAHPSRFSGVAVLSAHPGLTDEMERTQRQLADAGWAKDALHLPWAEFLHKWDQQAVLGPSKADRCGLEQHRLAISRAFDEWSLGRQPDLRLALRHISCPLLWITGAEDVKFTQLASQAGSGRHEIIPGAGHRVHFDQPQAVAAVLRQFWESICP